MTEPTPAPAEEQPVDQVDADAPAAEDDDQQETGIEIRMKVPRRRVVLQAGGRLIDIDAEGEPLADIVAAAERLWPLTNDPLALRAHDRPPMGFVALGSDTERAGDGDDDEEARAA